MLKLEHGEKLAGGSFGVLRQAPARSVFYG